MYKTNSGRDITYLGFETSEECKVINKEFEVLDNINTLFLMLLANAWDKDTVSPHYKENYSRNNNPTQGQCTITAILVQEIFGGSIKQVIVGESHHSLNEINGVLYDLARDQFDIQGIKIDYTNLITLNREELLSNEDVLNRYTKLKNNVLENI